MKPATLIVLSGLPGVGKTTIARAIAARRNVSYVRIDSIEDGLAASQLGIVRAEDAGHRAAWGVVADNLLPGRWVLADAVNEDAWCQDNWTRVAREASAHFLPVQIVCSDAEQHRARVHARKTALRGKGPGWHDILARRWEPWQQPRLLIDTASTSADAAAEDIVAAALSHAG